MKDDEKDLAETIKKRQERDNAPKFTNTHKANQFNSTDFTDCCGLAVLKEETKCPRCGASVLVRSKL